jgi:hypothetical protein
MARKEPGSLPGSRGFMTTGLFLRVIFALALSILIGMAFFATTALSH